MNVYDLRKFCELEWPAFGVGWLDVGTLDVGPAGAVRAVCYGSPGHSDQALYIDTWIDILVDKPSYLKGCGCPQRKGEKGERAKVFLAKQVSKGPRRPPVLPSAPESPGQGRLVQGSTPIPCANRSLRAGGRCTQETPARLQDLRSAPYPEWG